MIKLQALLVAALGIATAFAGLLAVDGHGESLRPLGFGELSIVEGALYVALAGTIAQHSRVACLLACGLILLDAGLLLVVDDGVVDPPALVLLAVARAAIVIVLLRRIPKPARPVPAVSEAMMNAARVFRVAQAASAAPPGRETAYASTLVRVPSSARSQSPDADPAPEASPAFLDIEAATVLAHAAPEVAAAVSSTVMDHTESARDAASDTNQVLPASPLLHVSPSVPVTLANTVDDQGQICCPKCGLRQIDCSACFGCGIDFARYWNARRRVLELEARLGRSHLR